MKPRHQTQVLTGAITVVLRWFNVSTSFSRCRVDFWKAATRNYKIFLGLAREPNVRILDSSGREVAIDITWI